MDYFVEFLDSENLYNFSKYSFIVNHSVLISCYQLWDLTNRYRIVLEFESNLRLTLI